MGSSTPKRDDEFAEEPVSPISRLMQESVFDLCVLAVFGFKTSIDLPLFINFVSQTFVKHPRFSSLMVADNGKRNKLSWKQVTVDLNNHVFAPNLDPEMDRPDEFLEEFTARLSKTRLDAKKPLWEIYVLNVRTSDANSTVIFKIDHSIGDGVSLISLVLACSRKISDPQALPTLPKSKKHMGHIHENRIGMMKRFPILVWTLVLVMLCTLIDTISMLLTIIFWKDSRTLIKGSKGVESSPKKFVHRIVSLDDVKLVKNATNASINDVMLAVIEAGINRYLTTRVVKEHATDKIKNVHMRLVIAYNLRPSPTIQDLADVMEKGMKLDGLWGNRVGLILIPIKIGLQEDPLSYINRAKATMQRKKLSLSPKFIFFILQLIIKIFGFKVAGKVIERVLHNTTFGFSNLMGPSEEISLCGHTVSYISPTVVGFPQALVIHCQSYCNKLAIAIAADEKLIPNPHLLCDDFQTSLQIIKQAVIDRGLVDPSNP